MALGLARIGRAVLLGPAALARIAALSATEAEARWLLQQPRGVRASYVSSVLDSEREPDAQEIWMLRQPRGARASYVREVLNTSDDANAQEIWMLRQPKAVRESYIHEVLDDSSGRPHK